MASFVLELSEETGWFGGERGPYVIVITPSRLKSTLRLSPQGTAHDPEGNMIGLWRWLEGADGYVELRLPSGWRVDASHSPVSDSDDTVRPRR